MAKALYIAEKPSVAQEFTKALKLEMRNHNGYKEGETAVVTWCVGHLVTMSYPEVYDEKYKKWSLETLPFLPEEFLYEVIPSAKNQYEIVSQLLNREDVDTIYVCTDSGREGEYIYRLVEQMSGVKDKGKQRKRVWIDSQTEEEILRGIREAKDLSEYDNLSDSAYLRAKEDYLMGINFSRLLTLKYGNTLANYLHERYTVISVGRVMTCVQGMVVRREREIREFVKTPFYRVFSSMAIEGTGIESEWKAVEGSKFYQSPKLYKDNGFLQKLNDYLNRYFVKVCGEYLALLNAQGQLAVQAVKMGVWIGKKGTIDIIAQDSVRQNIVAICNWSKSELTDEMWKNLEFSMKQAKIKAEQYYLFSAQSFDEAIRERAEENPKIKLIDMNEL